METTGAFAARAAAAEEAGRVCAICQTPVAQGEIVGPCPDCSGLFHEDCWTENGGCAIYGCPRMPKTVKAAESAPATYWGQDQKECPKCLKSIRVSAVRCRFCGETFETAAPITRREHREAEQAKPRVDSMKKGSVALFVCGLIPCIAPLAAIVGGIWFLTHRKEIGKLPAMNQVFCYVGLVASVLTTALLVFVMMIV